MSYRNTKTPSKAEITAKPKWQLPKRREPKSGAMEYVLEDENRERFIKLFPVHSTRRIMQWFGISFSTCQRFKRRLGLQKDMKAIRKEHARDTKRICEANGWYDSLRGKAPSEAAIEATRRMRASGFNPIKEFAKKHPAKYRNLVKKRAEGRKELIRKEHLREKYGLRRQTKLRLTLQPLSHKASGQKYAMIVSCNYFADSEHPSWVCYDSETRRSPKRESTAMKHGLRIIEGEGTETIQS